MSFSERAISFPGGAPACIVETAPVLDGDALLERLDLPPTRGTLVVNGSTAPLDAGGGPLHDVLARGVADVALADGLTVITGATDAGIFSLVGSALSAATAPLIGVAPLGLVAWPGGPPAHADRQPLEAHHSHFVLVEGSEWGDETGTMLALAGALGRRAPSAAILCGGGPVAQLEALGHVRAGRPLVVLAGSGRLADDLAAAVGGDGPPRDQARHELVNEGDLVVVPLAAGAEQLAATLREVLAAQRWHRPRL